MANTYLSNTYADGGNHQIGTHSFWLKRNKISADDEMVLRMTNGSQYFHFKFDTSDIFTIQDYQGTHELYMRCAKEMRDVLSWYHVVVRIDTTQATETDRVRLYINGELMTAFEQVYNGSAWVNTIYPTQNKNLYLGEQQTFYIGSTSSANYFNGLMSHFHYCDGYSYGADSFGSTDSTTGIWKINTSPSVSYGTNGFFILKDGNSVTDQSGQSNNWTVGGGNLTNSEDCPSNVFTTLNPLQGGQAGTMGLMEGNLYLSGNGSSSWRAMGSTLAAKSGKFYWEGKIIGGVSQMRIGICDIEQIPGAAGTKFTVQSRGYGVDTSNLVNNNSNVGGFTVTSFTTDDILMFALDLDNAKFYVGKNGTWMNSGDPTTGSTGTGAASITSGYYYTPCSEHYDSSANFAYNFGNGYFRTTQISSEGTNASGIGKFEYDVPTGYTALSTKGLNE